MSKRPLLELDKPQQKDFLGNMKYGTAEPYKVLLFTIIKPDKPIDVNVLHKICTPLGRVIRIVIFRTKGIQAMIEFEKIEIARKVKDALNGEDIYADCCTLKIEFAVPQLTVLRNNKDSWDYTNPNLGSGDMEEAEPKVKKPLLLEAPPIQDSDYHRPSPHAGHKPSWDEHKDYMYSPQLPLYDHAPPSSRGSYQDYEEDASQYGPPPLPLPYVGDIVNRLPRLMDMFRGAMADTAYNSGPELSEPSPVLKVHNLNRKMASCDRLFNLFCLYGFVSKIKFLKSEGKQALVEMGDNESVQQCIEYLANAHLFERNLKLAYSNHPYVEPPLPAASKMLMNNSPPYKDYTGSRLQRFGKGRVKYMMKRPTKLLHFFGTPADFNEEKLIEIFDKGMSSYSILKKPTKVTFFAPNDNKSSGSLTFEKVADALNALVFFNNTLIKRPDGVKFFLKLSFYMFKPQEPKFKTANDKANEALFKEIDD